jgi:hypothetical protein
MYYGIIIKKLKGGDMMFKFAECVSKVTVKKLTSENRELVAMVMKSINHNN